MLFWSYKVIKRCKNPENFAISVDFANSVALRVWGTKFPVLTQNLSSLILQCTIIIQQHIYTFINIFHGKLTCNWQEFIKCTLRFKTSHKHKSLLSNMNLHNQGKVNYLWNSPNHVFLLSFKIQAQTLDSSSFLIHHFSHQTILKSMLPLVSCLLSHAWSCIKEVWMT
jgi:hypothetical protein